MLLYHGSTQVVEKPLILESARMLDFGMGFYATMNREQAIRWAEKVAIRRKTDTRYLSIYEFDFEQAKQELRILLFDEANASWLDFVTTCRSGRKPPGEYDIVFGPVADDNVYATLQLYEQRLLTRDETLSRLKIEALYNQILFHTEQALKSCKFKCAETLTIEAR